jgi:hypothetical protein
MLNTKYLSNVFLYFFTPYGLQYIFIIGFYYLIQDYFLFLFSYFKDFSLLNFLTKENFKFLIVSLVFFCVLF